MIENNRSSGRSGYYYSKGRIANLFLWFYWLWGSRKRCKILYWDDLIIHKVFMCGLYDRKIGQLSASEVPESFNIKSDWWWLGKSEKSLDQKSDLDKAKVQQQGDINSTPSPNKKSQFAISASESFIAPRILTLLLLEHLDKLPVLLFCHPESPDLFLFPVFRGLERGRDTQFNIPSSRPNIFF